MSVFSKKENPVNPKAMNQLGQGTIIEGDISSDADIRIDGKVKGNVTTKGKLVLGSVGIIEGDVFCLNGYVEGKINGKIESGDLLILSKTALVNGDIIIKKLVVEEGAKFNGKCVMGVQVSRNSELDKEATSVRAIQKAM